MLPISRTPACITVEDLLYRFPLRYEDRSRLQPIASLKAGQTASIAGRVLSCGLRSTRRPGFKIFEALIADDSGSIRATWLNQPFLRDVFDGRPARRALRPRRDPRRRRPAAHQPAIRDPATDEEGETIHTGRIVPVYEKAGSVTPKIQRRLVPRRPAAPARRRSAITLPEARAAAAGPPDERRAALLRRAFPPLGRAARGAEPFCHARPAAADLRGGVSVSELGVLLRRRPASRRAQEQPHDPRGRPHPRLGAERAAVPADRGPEAGAEGNRRRPAAAAAR